MKHKQISNLLSRLDSEKVRREVEKQARETARLLRLFAKQAVGKVRFEKEDEKSRLMEL